MAKGFKHGAGGNNPLNFEVVGGTSAPSNPKENMIWVDTDVPITSWQFAGDDPNLLDFSYWANTVSVTNGTKTVSGNAITLNASGNDCYTDYNSADTFIPCVPGKTYVMEWEHSGDNGRVFIFPNGGTGGMVLTSATDKRLECTIPEGITKISFRVGVGSANDTATYSNIRITEKERSFAPGAVWITTGTSSNVAFNALKKNGIQVYPMSAKQYIGGAWVDKTAKSYQNNEWVDWWGGHYVKNGIFRSEPIVNGYTLVNNVLSCPSGTKNESSYSFGIAFTNVKCKKLTFDLSIGWTSWVDHFFGIKKLSSGLNSSYVASSKISASSSNGGGDKTITVDLSGVPDGEYYIAMSTSSGSGGSAAEIKINNIWVE